MLLLVSLRAQKIYSAFPIRRASATSRRIIVVPVVFVALAALVALVAFVAFGSWRTVSAARPVTPPPSQTATPATANAIPPSGAPQSAPGAASPGVLNVVVLDAAHGGTDPGARGTGGIRESEVVLQFAAQVRRSLEAQGFQVVQTRTGDENPSFDDRSQMANAQRGAVFVTLHISSTGLAGTARVYVNDDLPPITDPSGLIPWDQAQGPFLDLSRKFGDLVQGFLTQRFKGSPPSAQTASVRQLRTTAAPAIAVEISSVSVEKREDLDRMGPGVADAIARGVVAFKPSYVVPVLPQPSPIAAPIAGPVTPTAPPAAKSPGTAALGGKP